MAKPTIPPAWGCIAITLHVGGQERQVEQRRIRLLKLVPRDDIDPKTILLSPHHPPDVHVTSDCAHSPAPRKRVKFVPET